MVRQWDECWTIQWAVRRPWHLLLSRRERECVCKHDRVKGKNFELNRLHVSQNMYSVASAVTSRSPAQAFEGRALSHSATLRLTILQRSHQQEPCAGAAPPSGRQVSQQVLRQQLLSLRVPPMLHVEQHAGVLAAASRDDGHTACSQQPMGWCCQARGGGGRGGRARQSEGTAAGTATHAGKVWGRGPHCQVVPVTCTRKWCCQPHLGAAAARPSGRTPGGGRQQLRGPSVKAGWAAAAGQGILAAASGRVPSTPATAAHPWRQHAQCASRAQAAALEGTHLAVDGHPAVGLG